MSKILEFTGNVVGGIQANDAAKEDAAVLRTQARSARQQALQDEYAQRRGARQFEGHARAAAAQAGGGEGGSVEMLLEQSAIMAELDALNIRYGGEMRARGLLAEARATRKRGQQAFTAGMFGAGAALMRDGGGGES